MADCDGWLCGICLDDPDAEGNWTDSDSAAELSHTQRLGRKQGACQCRAMPHSAGNHSRGSNSLPATVNQFIALLFAKVRSACRDLFGHSSATPGSLSQSMLLLEVSLLPS